MNEKKNSENPVMAFNWMKDAYEYWLDSTQRWILFMDILRKRGNNYFETIKKGGPPVLVFDYKIILSGVTLERPLNYDLAVILPRKTDTIDPEKRPIGNYRQRIKDSHKKWSSLRNRRSYWGCQRRI